MTFQAQVNLQPAPACEGDFASANPRGTVLAGAGALVAGANGLVIGQFAWADANGACSNTGQGVPTGYVHREMQGLITAFLAEFGVTIPQGLAVTLYSHGDFWDKTTTTATKGQKVFASMLDGTTATATAASTIVSASFTGSFATNVLTVTAVASGTLAVGSLVIGTGVPAGTYIASQTGGTPGGVGTYTLTTTPGTITSQANTTTNYVETKWIVATPGAANELIKITIWG